MKGGKKKRALVLHCANPPRDELIAIMRRRLKARPIVLPSGFAYEQYVDDASLGFWCDEWALAMTEYFEGQGFEVNYSNE